MKESEPAGSSSAGVYLLQELHRDGSLASHDVWVVGGGHHHGSWPK